MTAKVEDRVRRFIIEELHFQGSSKELTDDYPLLENGALDSMGLMQLIALLEREYGIEVEDEELVSQNFGTLRGIGRIVESKLAG